MEKLLRELIEKIKTLTMIQALSVLRELNQTDSIMVLYNMGIAQKDIAEILSTKINIVTSTVTRKRKKNI